jgi:hypothetical protein
MKAITNMDWMIAPRGIVVEALYIVDISVLDLRSW